jgi:hypothetical protein
LTHVNLVRLHALHETDDPPLAAISMEYVAGGNLAQEKTKQAKGCFSAEELEPWVRQLCDVLTYVHEQAKTVHRDLKPGNLLLTAERQLKLADFGIASSLAETGNGLNFTGTPAYMSPQQANGEDAAVSDDIHALGATLYDLLASRPPFEGNQTVILKQLMDAMPVSIAERRAGLKIEGVAPVPSAWEETIAACLAKEPADRPASAAEVARRLLEGAARSREDTTVRVPVTQVQSEAERPAPGRPWAGLIAALVVVALLVGGMVWWRPHTEEKIVAATPTAATPEAAPAMASAAQTAGLKLEPIQVELMTDKASYRAGEEPVVTVTSSVAGHLRLFYQNAAGEVVILFPNQYATDDRIEGGKGLQVMPRPNPKIPGDEVAIAVREPFGTEVLGALVSAEPFPDEATLLRELQHDAFASGQAPDVDGAIAKGVEVISHRAADVPTRTGTARVQLTTHEK